jgi:hypothetical protein
MFWILGISSDESRQTSWPSEMDNLRYIIKIQNCCCLVLLEREIKQRARGEGDAISDGVVKEGLTEKMTFEWRHLKEVRKQAI